MHHSIHTLAKQESPYSYAYGLVLNHIWASVWDNAVATANFNSRVQSSRWIERRICTYYHDLSCSLPLLQFLLSYWWMNHLLWDTVQMPALVMAGQPVPHQPPVSCLMATSPHSLQDGNNTWASQLLTLKKLWTSLTQQSITFNFTATPQIMW